MVYPSPSLLRPLDELFNPPKQFRVLSSASVAYIAPLTVKSSAVTPYIVSKTVLSSAGVAYTV